MIIYDLYKEINKRLQLEESISIKSNNDYMVSIYKDKYRSCLFSIYNIKKSNDYIYILFIDDDGKMHASMSDNTDTDIDHTRSGMLCSNDGGPYYAFYPTLKFGIGMEMPGTHDTYIKQIFALLDQKREAIKADQSLDKLSKENNEKLIKHIYSIDNRFTNENNDKNAKENKETNNKIGRYTFKELFNDLENLNLVGYHSYKSLDFPNVHISINHYIRDTLSDNGSYKFGYSFIPYIIYIIIIGNIVFEIGRKLVKVYRIGSNDYDTIFSIDDFIPFITLPSIKNSGQFLEDMHHACIIETPSDMREYFKNLFNIVKAK